MSMNEAAQMNQFSPLTICFYFFSIVSDREVRTMPKIGIGHDGNLSPGL